MKARTVAVRTRELSDELTPTQVVPNPLGNTLAIALQHHEAGRLSEAEVLYRWVVDLQPNHSDALHLLGVLEHQRGDNAAAMDLLGRAIALNPRDAVFRSNFGIAARDLGHLDEAIASFRHAVALKPEYAEAYINLGVALSDSDRLIEAIDCFHHAVRLKPDSAEARNNLGLALTRQGCLDEAIATFLVALALRPGFTEAHHNLGNVYRERGELDRAADSFSRGLAQRPDDAEAHFGLALVRLHQGELEAGFAEYEWRWRCPSFATGQRALPAQPMWDGGAIERRTILLHAEQGLGDTLQFLRYVPLVAGRGARVVLEVQRELLPLLGSLAGTAQVVARDEPLPAFDVHAPLLSLPHLLRTTHASIPAEVPYLRADPARVAAWREHRGMVKEGVGLRVGLVWDGSHGQKQNHRRSLALDALAPLGEVPGIQFVALQKGEAASQASSPPPGLELINLGPALVDFGDTAAVLEQLDLTISVDTSVAHLAGALGRPVWVLLPFASDWRWLKERSDSPWYPTARLFRQATPGDWPGVTAQVTTALGELSRQRHSGA